MNSKLSYTHYHAPQDILQDNTLSNSQKMTLLEDWAQDEQQKLIAEEENMALTDDDDKSAKLLSEIHQALAQLQTQKK